MTFEEDLDLSNLPAYDLSLSTIASLQEPAHNITVNNPQGKKLIIDFSTDTLKVSGDLPYDEAAKIFIDAVGSYLYGKYIDREKVKEVIEKIRDKTLTDERNGDLYSKELIEELKL